MFWEGGEKKNPVLCARQWTTKALYFSVYEIRLTGFMFGMSVTAVLKDLNFISKFIMITFYRLLCMLLGTIIKALGVMLTCYTGYMCLLQCSNQHVEVK